MRRREQRDGGLVRRVEEVHGVRAVVHRHHEPRRRLADELCRRLAADRRPAPTGTMTARGRERLSEERRRREHWLAEAIAAELTPDEQQTLLDAVPLLRRLTEV